MNIELINKDIVEFTKDGKNHILNYGYRQRNSDLKTDLKIETKEIINIIATCPCTTIDKTKTDYGYDVSLAYDSKRLNSFSKVLKIMADKKVIGEITLRGTIL